MEQRAASLGMPKYFVYMKYVAGREAERKRDRKTERER
jgi:hypothetical protein